MQLPTKKILLVEDNKQDEILALRAFQNVKMNTIIKVVRDGAEAIEYLKHQSPPHVIFMDIKLPKFDGHEVLKSVRSNPETARIPVILFSSSSELSDIGKGYELGANSYVRKPVEYGMFMNVIQMLSFYWLELNESPISELQ